MIQLIIICFLWILLLVAALAFIIQQNTNKPLKKLKNDLKTEGY